MTRPKSEPELVPVKNISRGPQALEGGGVLAPEQTGKAPASDHLTAQIEAGLLLDLSQEKE